MDASDLLKLADGIGTIGVVGLGLLYLAFRSRRPKSGNGDSMSKDAFHASVQESRRLADERHEETKGMIQTIGDEAKTDRQNLYTHVANHPGPSGSDC